MEKPILNKTATNWDELFVIPDERKEFLSHLEEEISLKPGTTPFAMIYASILLKAETVEEQLYLTVLAYSNMMNIAMTNQIDLTQIVKDED